MEYLTIANIELFVLIVLAYTVACYLIIIYEIACNKFQYWYYVNKLVLLKVSANKLVKLKVDNYAAILN